MSRSITATDQRESPIVYFDVELDDLGLTVYEYRAYGRIARRASGGKRTCTESLDSMAAGCQMSRRSLVNAIKGLIARRMIVRESKLGDTSTYCLTDKSTWVPGAPDAHPTRAPYAQGVGTICPGGGHHMPTPGAPRAQGGGHHMPTKNTSKENKKNTSQEVAALSTAEVYAEVAGRQLSIREIELVEAKVPDSEVEQFREWLTGWAATYGTKAVFKTLEAYARHRDEKQRRTVDPGKLVNVLDLFTGQGRSAKAAVVGGTVSDGTPDLDQRPEPARDQDDFFTRQAADLRSR